jgi:hypothetical protein
MRFEGDRGRQAAVPLETVVGAWQEVGGLPPARVEPVRLRNKSAVYRLREAGLASANVIAKRGAAEALRNEWTIYAQVLPRLPLTRARAYGFVEPGDGSAWLFLEDAGDVLCDPEAAPVLAAGWLGTLHGAAATLDLAELLPDRGPPHYREHIRAARRTITRHSDNEALTASDRRFLSELLSICGEIEERWSVLEDICAAGPRTLAHGDFVKRNLRVRREQGADALVALDWECAGVAAPAADLELLILHPPLVLPYLSAIERFLPGLSGERISELGRIGVGLRLLAAVDWATAWLECSWPQTGMAQLRTYEPSIRAWARSLALCPA